MDLAGTAFLIHMPGLKEINISRFLGILPNQMTLGIQLIFLNQVILLIGNTLAHSMSRAQDGHKKTKIVLVPTFSLWVTNLY